MPSLRKYKTDTCFSSPLHLERLWGPPGLLSNGHRGLFLSVKAAGTWADDSPPASAEVKNAWSYTSTPQIVFMAWCYLSTGKLYLYHFIFICFLTQNLILIILSVICSTFLTKRCTIARQDIVIGISLFQVYKHEFRDRCLGWKFVYDMYRFLNFIV
jgi:hypothetical protein